MPQNLFKAAYNLMEARAHAFLMDAGALFPHKFFHCTFIVKKEVHLLAYSPVDFCFVSVSDEAPIYKFSYTD